MYLLYQRHLGWHETLQIIIAREDTTKEFCNNNVQRSTQPSIPLGVSKKGEGEGTVYKLDKLWANEEAAHGTATECHLPYGITQCYLVPDTSEHTPH